MPRIEPFLLTGGGKPGVANLGFPARNADSEPHFSLSLDCTLLLPNPLGAKEHRTVVPIPSFGVVPRNRKQKNFRTRASYAGQTSAMNVMS